MTVAHASLAGYRAPPRVRAWYAGQASLAGNSPTADLQHCLGLFSHHLTSSYLNHTTHLCRSLPKLYPTRTHSPNSPIKSTSYL